MRWSKAAGSQPGAGHARAGGRGPGRRRGPEWEQPFDAALTDVFQVQADIAGKVASALDVALGDSVRQ